ncbi:MAG: hypothetical protein GY777_11970 [Candidatus Brocadiaceae bacterium]|nr:hypothetical protein [Candidatus Brocadiaceae bacterium]
MKICRYVCVLVIILIMAIFTMSEGSRKIKIGYDIMAMENELAMLLEDCKRLKFESGKLRKPEKISMKVKNMELGLSIKEDEDIAVVKKSHKRMNNKLLGKIEA